MCGAIQWSICTTQSFRQFRAMRLTQPRCSIRPRRSLPGCSFFARRIASFIAACTPFSKASPARHFVICMTSVVCSGGILRMSEINAAIQKRTRGQRACSRCNYRIRHYLHGRKPQNLSQATLRGKLLATAAFSTIGASPCGHIGAQWLVTLTLDEDALQAFSPHLLQENVRSGCGKFH